MKKHSLLPAFALLGLLAACHSPRSGNNSKNDSALAAETVNVPPQASTNVPTLNGQSNIAGLASRYSSNADKGAGFYAVTVSDGNGCVSSPGGSSPYTPPSGNSMNAAPPLQQHPEKIIRTGQMRLLVENYAQAHSRLSAILKKHRAYTGSEQEQHDTFSISNTLLIRVPGEEFDQLMNDLEPLATEVTFRSSNMEDVTAQYVDLEARLKAKQEVEKNYLDLLAKAHTISESLEVQDYLGNIRAEIESMQGQMKYINDQASLSSLTLTLTQQFEGAPVHKPGFGSQLGNSFSAGWTGFLNFVLRTISKWPALLLLALIGFAVYRYARRLIRWYRSNEQAS